MLIRVFQVLSLSSSILAVVLFWISVVIQARDSDIFLQNPSERVETLEVIDRHEQSARHLQMSALSMWVFAVINLMLWRWSLRRKRRQHRPIPRPAAVIRTGRRHRRWQA